MPIFNKRRSMYAMPSVTKKKGRAMAAAAAGKSKLGIPKSVGKEYVAADRKAGKVPPKPPAHTRIGRKTYE